ncbi:hypothetical protein MMC30_007295 [Trapelia coarctata]|nr:hypothetical protein [Trapelia coarctata]
MSKSEFKQTVSRLSRLASLPDPMETVPPKLYNAGEVLLKSGVVCWDYEYEVVILHSNKVTGEITLPKAACKWLSEFEGSAPVLESFDITAERIASYQLGFQSNIVRYHPEESLQPYTVKSGTPLRMNTPFLFQSEASPGNVLEVTAWFLASFDLDDQPLWGSNSRLKASARGEEWEICVHPVENALSVVSEHDRTILRHAIVARNYNNDLLTE